MTLMRAKSWSFPNKTTEKLNEEVMEKLSEAPTITEATTQSINKLLTLVFLVGFVFYMMVSTAIFRS